LDCNGALRKKFEYLLDLNADIYIIQECENPEEAKDKKYKEWAENFLWIGDTENKSLGVFATNEIELSKLNWSNQYKDHRVKYFLPCAVNQAFNLLAIWTHQNNSPNFGYIGQLWKYLQVNNDKLKKVIIAGDFNSNSIWDQWDRWWNHSDVVKELQKLGIESFYHKFTSQEQGKETIPTLYFQRKIEKPFHIDYVFGSKEFVNELKCVKIGPLEKWLKISDHMPIICEFEISNSILSDF
jgi:exonuclease III